MKKNFFILLAIASTVELCAQEPADALRYSWYISSGTARQQSIGGAMTSLGGDLSATFVNPAGLGFYKTGDFVLTPTYNFINNKATYYGHKEKDKRSYFGTGTSGFVLGKGDDKHSSAFAIAVNRTANFGSNLLYRGINNESSYSQKFLEEIRNNNDRNANSVAQNYPFGTSLAFNTYWIDTIAGGTPGTHQFQTRAPIGTGLIQENIVTSRGGITELAIAFAGSTKNKWFYGATLGIPFLSYTRETSYSEADATDNPNNKFDFATIDEYLNTVGAGLNLKLGVIYKPTEYVRLGLAVHTPTFFSLSDEYNAFVVTDTEGYEGRLNQSSKDFTNGENAEFEYHYFTPYRISVSGSYVLREIEDVRKQKGFLTADIEFVNYKASSYSTNPDGDNSESTKAYLKELNKAIDNAYKAAFNFKVGGELKFTTLMVRLGAAYYGNPYKDIAGEKGSRFQLSGGLGYRNKGMFIDVAYVHTMGKDTHFAYRLQDSPFAGARVKNMGGNAVLTVGFKI
jgi:hypothetical protein